MYSEGSPAVKQSNETAFSYFKKAADKVNRIHRMKDNSRDELRRQDCQ